MAKRLPHHRHRSLVIWAVLAFLMPLLAFAPAAYGQAAGPRPGDGSSGAPRSDGTNPSERLDKSDGVIQPPGGIDPQMQITPPDSGTLRIIPAPGTPGGKSDVVPK